jgi:hypothetical protein
MRLAHCRTWLAMRVEAGLTDAIPILAGDLHFAVKRCEWAYEMQPKPPSVIPAWMSPPTRAQFSK